MAIEGRALSVGMLFELGRSSRLGCNASLALGVSGALLVWSLRHVDVHTLEDLDVWWAAFGVLLTVPMTLLSALRWANASEQAGVPLSFRTATERYYLASLLNQLLPGGVAGDVLRAHRHGRESSRYAPAAASVVAERTAGQVVLALVGLPALAYVGLLEPYTAAMLVGLVAVLLFLASWWHARGPIDGSLLPALFEPRAMMAQLGLSALILGSYLAIFGTAAAALSLPLGRDLWFGAFPTALLAMSLPVGFAGWGLREGAALIAFEALGRPAADGVALGLTYGAMVFVGALPGALSPILGRRTAVAPQMPRRSKS